MKLKRPSNPMEVKVGFTRLYNTESIAESMNSIIRDFGTTVIFHDVEQQDRDYRIIVFTDKPLPIGEPPLDAEKLYSILLRVEDIDQSIGDGDYAYDDFAEEYEASEDETYLEIYSMSRDGKLGNPVEVVLEEWLDVTLTYLPLAG